MEMDVLDNKENKLTLENIDLKIVLSEAVQLMSNMAKEKNIELRLIDELPDCTIQGDKVHTSLIFENLISNAIKFSEKNTKVEILAKKNNSKIQVKISDQGVGIKPKEKDELFKKFSKLSSRPTAGEPSTGLGLFLVKRHVELIGGKVWYDENSKNGSTFVVELLVGK